MTLFILEMVAKGTVGALALSCYASFIWSILRFFRRDRRMPTRMKIISLTGSLGMLAHLFGIITLTRLDSVRLLLSCAGFGSSLALFWWSLRTIWECRFAIAFSLGEPQHVVRTGPYQFSRHPIYLSYTVAWFAGAIAIPALWPWLIVVAMVVQYIMAIIHEESQFRRCPLAIEYHEYAQCTGMIVPNPFKCVRASRARILSKK